MSRGNRRARKVRGPHADKYAGKSEAAQHEREQLNRRFLQRERDRQKAEEEAKKLAESAKQEPDGLADWERDLLEAAKQANTSKK